MAAKQLPDVETLRKLLDYDPETGILTWKPRTAEMFEADERRSAEHRCNNWNSLYAGKRAFSGITNFGYCKGDIFKNRYLAHRIIFVMQTGRPPTADIDHINGNRSDNRWVNLRPASRSQNNKNRSSSLKASSQFMGVSVTRDRWHASIKVDGRKHCIGNFLDETEAARAYDAAAVKHHGEFARLNFPRAESKG
jgi:hypothetical protein